MTNLANVASRLQARYLQTRSRGKDPKNTRAMTQRKRRGAVPALWLMTDVARLGTIEHVLQTLPVGTPHCSIGLIIRHTEAVQLRRMAEALVPACRQRKVCCIIAGDWVLAAQLRADGLHLSERGAARGPAPGARLWRRGKGRILTVAAHGMTALARADRRRPDAILLAPVFLTASHPHATALGALRFAALARRTRAPVIALGGVTPRTALRLIGSGAAGLAGVGWAERATQKRN